MSEHAVRRRHIQFGLFKQITIFTNVTLVEPVTLFALLSVIVIWVLSYISWFS